MEDSAGKINVIVKAFGGLREVLGSAGISLSLPAGADVERLLTVLGREHPTFTSRLEDGLSHGYVNVLVNGRNIRFLAGRTTRLADGDSVAFLPPVGGG